MRTEARSMWVANRLSRRPKRARAVGRKSSGISTPLRRIRSGVSSSRVRPARALSARGSFAAKVR
jgi:hypothetical protein